LLIVDGSGPDDMVVIARRARLLLDDAISGRRPAGAQNWLIVRSGRLFQKCFGESWSIDSASAVFVTEYLPVIFRLAELEAANFNDKRIKAAFAQWSRSP
jgi:hypothetical protein